MTTGLAFLCLSAKLVNLLEMAACQIASTAMLKALKVLRDRVAEAIAIDSLPFSEWERGKKRQKRRFVSVDKPDRNVHPNLCRSIPAPPSNGEIASAELLPSTIDLIA